MSERRCARCGALVAEDAEWCGQCYAGLREPSTAARASSGGRTLEFRTGLEPAGGEGPPTAWRCPTCDTENGLDANVCRVCGTSFGRLFEDREAASVSPAAAAAWSLLLPGLGHWLVGRHTDAVARFVLGVWIALMLVVLAASRSGEGAMGSVGALLALFAVAAVALWGEAFVDARRVAAGRDPVVSSRKLLWGCVGLIGLSIALSTIFALGGLGAAPQTGRIP